MAFKKKSEDIRKVTLIPLVDAIFLLLIYFLVVSIGGSQSRSQYHAEFEEVLVEPGELELTRNLPRPDKTISPERERHFPDLLIQIEETGNGAPQDSLVFFLLDSLVTCPREAMRDTSTVYFGSRDNRYRDRRGPFPFQKSSGEIIQDTKQRIIDRIAYIKKDINPYPSLEIRAHKKTKYGSIVEIFKICQKMEIKGVNFWVLKGRLPSISEREERESGI